MLPAKPDEMALQPGSSVLMSVEFDIEPDVTNSGNLVTLTWLDDHGR